MNSKQLHIEYVALDQLKPATYNPRRISEKDFESLKRSLLKFGWAEPIVVNKRTDTIVGGHMRLAAANAIGLKDAPVVFVDLDLKAEKALNIALNKIAGEFDEDMLAELISELDDLTSFTGFDDDELMKLQADPFDDEDTAKTEAPKVDRFTIEQLRTLAQSYHPVEADTILDFLRWLEQHNRK